MKKIIFAMLSVCLLFSACYDDDSGEMGAFTDITIKPFELEIYSVISYAGKHLVVKPEVETGYAAEQLDYRWSVAKEMDKTNDNNNSEESVEWTEIGNERNLDYVVELEPGTYMLRYEVIAKDNNYTALQKAKLIVGTEFSNGFYILTETAEGNTELDMMTPTGEFMDNLLAAIDGQPMTGHPVGLSVSYQHYYVDVDDQQKKPDNVVFVATDAKEMAVKRSNDLRTIFTQEDISFEPLGADEQPMWLCPGMWGHTFVTSKGPRFTVNWDVTSGKYGVVTKPYGGSKYVVFDGMNWIYWDEKGCRFVVVDFNGEISLLTDPGTDQVYSYPGCTCVSSGYSWMLSTAIFVMQRIDGSRFMVKLTSGGVSGEVDIPGNNVTSTCRIFTVSSLQSVCLYATNGENIYMLSSEDGSERTVTAKGLTAGNITYVSNQYFGGMMGEVEVDYLIVATENNGKYTLHFYETLGGQPNGDPVYTVTGFGHVYSVRYLSNNPQGWGYDEFSLSD